VNHKDILSTSIIRKIIVILLLFGFGNVAYSAPGDMTISNMAGTWPITIRTCAHDAGAICSLTWGNKEFIDDYDHGRQLQSASSFDGLGESFNPTEAGGSYDGANSNQSSSVLQGSWNTSNVLATQTNMTFWKLVNGQATSNHILNKHVTIGVYGLAHVIEYATQFTVPSNEQHTRGIFEVVTGYMPAEFSSFWTFDVVSNTLSPLSDGPGEQHLPVILSTPDGGWAMGIYSPNSPQASWPTVGYGRFRFPAVVKWNNVFRIDNPQGVYHFRSYVIVGTLDDVKGSMTQLNNILNNGSSELVAILSVINNYLLN